MKTFPQSTSALSSTVASGDAGHATMHAQAHVLLKALAAAGIPDSVADLTDGAALNTAVAGKVPLSELTERVQDIVGALIVGGSGVSAVYDDPSGVLTISATGGGGGGTTDPAVVRSTIGAALSGVGLVSVAFDSAAGTLKISTTATANSTDAALRDRSTHTGTQAASTVTGLATVATSGSYADLSNKPTIPAAATTASTLALLPNLLKSWAKIPIDLAVGTITYNTSGAPTSHNVEWPDGATGVYTGAANATFPGSIDSYTVTHVLAGTTTTTYTQPAVTRDATTGQLTSRPTITVA